MRGLLIISILAVSTSLFAQLSAEDEAKIDSLQLVIENAKHDSTILNAWQEWDNMIYYMDPTLDMELNKKIDSLASLNLNRSINEVEKVFFLRKKASALNILGSIYHANGNQIKTMDCFFQALRIRESVGTSEEIATSLNALGIFYHSQGDFDKALKYYEDCRKMAEENNDMNLVATVNNNLGLTYEGAGDYDKALECYQFSVDHYEATGQTHRLGPILNNTGLVYNKQGKQEEALASYLESIGYSESIGDLMTKAHSLNNIADIYFARKDFRKANEYSGKALEIAEQYNFELIKQDATNTLWKAYRELRQYKNALEMYVLNVATRDSIAGAKNQREILQMEFDFAYEKKVAEDSLKAIETAKVAEARLDAEKVELKHQKQQSYFLYAGLGVALLFGIFIYRRFKVSQTQKQVIAEQKDEVDRAYDKLEERNKEITDSISYAKRIQSAILPAAALLDQSLSEHFVMYVPKDIVAGDFYWLENLGSKTLLAACDCTGHGVPGAMVSVVCNNGLNRSVREFGLTDPGKILDKTRALIIEEFEKSEDEVKDGMDIALVCLEGTTLQFAGAHNPLWIIRKGGTEIEEIKADKQPVGVFINPQPYTTHSIELEEGDSFYVFSDGYYDQFGGPQGKKYKAANFKKLLLSIRSQPMHIQKDKLAQAFGEWKGTLEQLDDVCVIGVRV